MIAGLRRAMSLLFGGLGAAFLIGGPTMGASRGWSGPAVAASLVVGAASLIVAAAMLRHSGDA